MHLTGRLVPVALASLLVAAVAAHSSGTAAAPGPASTRGTALARGTVLTTPVRAGASAHEVDRIHAHFDSVLVELNQRDVSRFTFTQRGRRNSLIATLRSYNARAVFPHNYDFPGQAMPYFVDRVTGTRCAVAFLLESTGRRDIVQRVARAHNNVWVAQLVGDSAFVAWLDNHALTIDEAARIQVPYVSTATQTRNVAFALTAPLAIGTAAAASVWNAWGNADGHRRFASVLGLTSGVLATTLGGLLAAKSDAPGTFRGAAGAGAAIGGLSIALSARAMHRHGRFLSSERAAARTRADVETRITPIVPVGRNAGAGMAVSVRF